MNDRVSIIVAVCNAEDFILSSVSSALAQSHRNIEVIVVDDGSTDATTARLAGIDDPRLTVIRQKNAGQGAALNCGVNIATGDYIKFFDADDWLSPRHVECQLDALKGSSTKVASCRWGYFRHSPEVCLVRDEPVNHDYANPVDWIVDSLTVAEGMMGGWVWLIPRRVWEECGGFDERLTLNNDFDFSLRLVLASSGVKHAAGAVYAYREGVEGSVSKSLGRKAMQSAFDTTESGCGALLDRENSPRTRKVCADRWQSWQYVFFPDYPDLAEQAGKKISSLGGSNLPMEGGFLLHAILPIIGWKNVRRLQSRVHRSAWRTILKWKAERRMARIGSGAE